MSVDKIAIVGMACRFPGANDLDQLWRNLRDGVESARRFTVVELAESGISAEIANQPNYVPVHATLDQHDCFDADFFDVSPREAEITDPQHRVLLECAWAALEHAAHDVSDAESLVGVYAGAGMSHYLLHNLVPQRKVLPVSDFQLLIGNNKDFVPTRVSYKLNLKGPSINVNTACSTSLVAVHLACQALLDYECDVALAGGVGIQVPQVSGYFYEEGGIVSPDGHCRPFDAAAQGTINGSGAGMVTLKRLDDALENGDTIHAVILGSAINNDGADKVGFTAPSVNGQAQVIADALAKAEVAADTIGYIEAHGTATVLGDPIEIAALTQVFREQTDRAHFCAIGSVKSNFGHLDEAAGVAGLIKAVLSLQHQKLPPSLHFSAPNPRLKLDGSPFYVNGTLQEWRRDGHPRRAGVSSFGIGGTNAHLVLEEFEPVAASAEDAQPQILTLSARSRAALESAESNLLNHLENTDQTLADIAFTLATGRRPFEYRRAVVASNRAEAVAALRRQAQAVRVGAAPRVVFMFSGQGSQYVGMGDALYAAEPVFREAFDRCWVILQRHVTVGSISAETLAQTRFVQPILFALEYALAQQWMAWGVQPAALIGHSLGEYVAACVAGVFFLEDALSLVCERGRLMQSCPAGAMAAVRCDEPTLLPYLNADVALAAVNGREQCVIAGERSAVEQVAARLEADNIFCRLLATAHGFHSPLMAQALPPFRQFVARLEMHAPQIPLVSNVTGGWISAEDATDPDYWTRHLRQTVRFADGLQLLAEHTHFIEIGAGNTLAALVERGLDAKNVVASLPRAREAGDDVAFLRRALGDLWVAGVTVDWSSYYAAQSRRRVPLPTYPFQRQRYWIDAPRHVPQTALPETVSSNLAIDDWFYRPNWQQIDSPIPLPLAQNWLFVGFDERTIAAFGRGLDAEFYSHSQFGEAHKTILQMQSKPAQIVCLWQAGATHGQATGTYFALLKLVQALDQRGWVDDVTLSVVTIGGAPVEEAEAVDPVAALVNGIVRVVPLEYAGVRCRQIDVDAPEVETLLAELTGGVGDVVAYRGGQRFVPTLVAHELAAAQPTVRRDGVYVVTGGLGSMGRAFTSHLSERGGTVVGLGRSSVGLALNSAEIQTQIAAQTDRFAIETLEAYPDLPQAMNRYCAALVVRYWAACGIDVAAGSEHTHEALRERLTLKAEFAKFYDFFVALLVQEGVAAQTADGLRLLGVDSAETLMTTLLANYPDFAGTVEYLDHCTSHYPAALSGEMPAINVLYPDGSPARLQQSEAATVEHRHDRVFIHALSQSVATLAAAHKRPLRILEVGGGNGNLTEVLVAALAEHQVAYHFTDLGRTFVKQAEETAAERGIDFMQFGVLDIARDPLMQGFEVGQFDLIVGYNVVHATRNVPEVLRHLDTLLVAGGVLGLVETVIPRYWDTLIWGLAEGWWYFEDTLRELTPLLSLPAWEAALNAQFAHVQLFPASGDAALLMTQKATDLASSYMQVDVSDRDGMAQALAQIRSEYGAIRGVVHTAGVLGQGLIRNKQMDDVAAVFAPKVRGTQILGELLRDDPLDFLLLCGSMASVAPIAGQVDYCAANAFMDAAAHELRRQGLPATCVDWGFWQELGMIDSAETSPTQKSAILQAIRDSGREEAGVAVFARMLAHAATLPAQLVVYPDRLHQPVAHPLLAQRAMDGDTIIYTAQLDPRRHWVLDEHRLDGTSVLPGTAYLELIYAALVDLHGQAGVRLQDVYFLAPLSVADGTQQAVRVVLQPAVAGYSFHIVSQPADCADDQWLEHVRGAARLDASDAAHELPTTEGFAAVAVSETMNLFGPRWGCLEQLAFGEGAGVAQLALPAPFVAELHEFALHPALLDMATGFLTLQSGLAGALPFAYGQVVVHRALTPHIVSHARLRGSSTAERVAFDVTICDPAGRVLVTVEDYQLRRVRDSAETVPQPNNFSITIQTPGLLDTLHQMPTPRRAPAADEVEIAVAAAGLNFIEVLYALGMLPEVGDPRFGIECAGRVVRVGADVRDFAVGDAVYAYAHAAFSAYATAPAWAVAHKPPQLSLVDAATIPAVFTTAYYALVTMGRLQKGERVLIHAASGGVGLAAVQIAQWIGAEVYATAGSAEKRDYVRSLGVKLVADSRSLTFADELRTVTDQVDVILNSLGGDFINKNLELLAPYGRFLELGKRDLFKNTQLDMHHFARSLSLMVIDVGPEMPQFSEVWQAVAARLTDGTFQPLPQRIYPIDQLSEAMQFMAQAQHIGKIVLSIDLTLEQQPQRKTTRSMAAILGKSVVTTPVPKGSPSATPPLPVVPSTSGYARPDLASAYVSASSATEATIVAIWEQLLGIDGIGVEDDFFDLRGDSLLAAQVTSQIQQQTGQRLPLSALFDAPTVAGLAQMLDADEDEMEEGEI